MFLLTEPARPIRQPQYRNASRLPIAGKTLNPWGENSESRERKLPPNHAGGPFHRTSDARSTRASTSSNRAARGTPMVGSMVVAVYGDPAKGVEPPARASDSDYQGDLFTYFVVGDAVFADAGGRPSLKRAVAGKATDQDSVTLGPGPFRPERGREPAVRIALGLVDALTAARRRGPRLQPASGISGKSPVGSALFRAGPAAMDQDRKCLPHGPASRTAKGSFAVLGISCQLMAVFPQFAYNAIPRGSTS